MQRTPLAGQAAPLINRRAAIAGAAALVLTRRALGVASESSPAEEPDRRWYEAAAAMKRLAESWGDQPYGAVLVLNGALIGEGPSRVVKNQDTTAHAEREAIRDAQRRLGRSNLSGSVLYSTSRPCSSCETAAAEAGVRRMYFGAALTDAGTPRTATR
jgi:tRNA(Arg) A34 adenosine deaminase TadA